MQTELTALMLRLMAVTSEGSLRKAGEVTPLTEIVAGAQDMIPTSDLSATIRQVGLELAEVMERGVKRAMLDAPYCYTDSFLQLIECHARILNAFENIAIDKEEAEQMQAEAALRSSSAAATQH